MSRIVSFVVLVAIALLVGVLSFRVMASFLLPMFLALVLAVIFRPLHKWFIARCAGHDRVAAVITTAAILLIVLIPTLLILTRAAAEAFSLATEVDPKVIGERLTTLRKKFHLEMPPQAVQETLSGMKKQLDFIEEALAGPDPSTDMRQHVPLFRDLVRAIHDELHLEGDPRPEDTFTPDARLHIAASWQTLDERSATLAVASPGTPEFATVFAEVETAYQAFRESLLGSQTLAWIRRQVNPDTDQISELLARLREFATPFFLGTGQAVGGFVGGFVVGLGVMIISLYYFLADGPTMIRAVMHLSPLDDRYEAELLNEFTTVSRAVVLATLLSAFAQGLLASIGYFFAGFQSVFLLTVVTMLLAMIPFVGAAAVWGACSLWLFLYDGRLGAALILATYGACVVSMIDNLIKPMVLHGQSKLHPLLALLSILGGIKVLGPIGIFVGPMGVAFLQALLSMVHAEIMALDDPGQPKAAAQTAPPAESLGRSPL
ncbi:MAG: AI-2E family transporter [Planctomycetia bacterium]|nr:AI-2E family transporter [Planctomycetia bacterium]